MSSSNSFNICPRCGNSNILNAKYCSRCGGELKLPEDPIVCHNCRTRNTPMANFCRNCGAELKVGYATKICTRCGREVPAEQSVCTCGYSFANTSYASPIPVRTDGTVDTTGVTATGATGDAKDKKVARAKDNKVYSHKGGRAFAIVAMVLLVIFAYLLVAPARIRPAFLSIFDRGITNDGVYPCYGYDTVMMLVVAIMGGSFSASMLMNGGMPQILIAALVAIFALAVLVHFIICLVRAIRPRRSRRANWCFFALAVLSTVVVALIAVFNYVTVSGNFFTKVANVFKLTEGWRLGFVLYLIPLYFWFFFLYSLIAKARALKEQMGTVESETAA